MEWGQWWIAMGAGAGGGAAAGVQAAVASLGFRESAGRGSGRCRWVRLVVALAAWRGRKNNEMGLGMEHSVKPSGAGHATSRRMR